MTSLKIAALAFALFAGWGSASAASIDYNLSVPLVDIGADDPTPTAFLRGTLSYDDATSGAVGTFSLIGLDQPVSAVFSGQAWLMPVSDTASGVLFDGTTSDGARLYLNIVAGLGANTTASGTVNYCTTGCSMFTGVGATITPADIPQIELPTEVTLPDPVLSPVPLPPALSSFGAALTVLGTVAAGRRLARLRTATWL